MTPPDNAAGWRATWTPPTVPADRDALVAEVARLRSVLDPLMSTLGSVFDGDEDLDMFEKLDACEEAYDAARAALADTAPRGGDGV